MHRFCCQLLRLVCAAAIPWAAFHHAARAADPHPDLKRLSPQEEVWVDPVRKEVIVGGRIAIDAGAIEFLACPEGTKEHESIVATRASARLVHAALLAIGLEPGSPVSFDPKYVAATGPRVLVRVRWKKPDGSHDTVDVRSWVRNTQTGRPLDADWVFAGSSFWTDPADGKEYYQADGGDLICVSNFPTATLDLPVESSQSNEALLFEAFEGRVPPRDTPVELILSGR
ncbi:MAG: YdjY domain-containing protein [Planctomycetia bacterium]